MNIKECFDSRFGENGYIVQADYSQLEVHALAYLSQDKVLIKELNAGADMHTDNASRLFKVHTPTKEQRTITKRLTFMLQYGSGYKNMARQLDIPEKTAKRFIDSYYDKYAGVASYQEDMVNEVTKNRRRHDDDTTLSSKYKSATGRVYTFQDVEYTGYSGSGWGKSKTPTVSPTQVKNYPVQGLATGDIVPTMLGRVHEALMELADNDYKRVLLINTVHDSLMFDVHREWLEIWKDVVYPILKNTNEYIEQCYGIKLPTRLKVDVEYGPSWSELSKLECE